MTTFAQPVYVPGTQTLNFEPFKAAVAAQFAKLAATGQLFRTGTSKDWLWETYLDAFPAGTNPIYRERTEHDCNCCKSFIRAVGNVVAVIDGQLETVWDVEVEGPYQVVANAMAAIVRAEAIANVFYHQERAAGVNETFEQLMEAGEGGVKTWRHFFVNLPGSAVVTDGTIGPKLSDARATHDVFLRSLSELTLEAIDTVLELMAQGSLYRGEEKKFAVSEFRKLKLEFDALTTAEAKDLFAWTRSKGLPPSVSRIRNDAVGTLLVNLSEGMELEAAVKAWEVVMAPANYQRPTALVTPKMLAQAKATIEGLGLMSALERRYAVLADIAVPNVVWANRQAKAVIAGNVFDELIAAAPEKLPNLEKVEAITIEKFLAEVVPTAKTIELLFENRHVPNLVSLITAADPTAGRLFKWNNSFSWAYNGEVADSIKERVKKAGGNVTGDLCCRLAWFNNDDLDFHMYEPGGYEISFCNKRQLSPSGGTLDVDMNGGDGMCPNRQPVENIVYKDKQRMREGVYRLVVHNYSQRETKDVGFEVEFDFLGEVMVFAYNQPVPNRGQVEVVEFEYSKTKGITVRRSLPSSVTTKKAWALDTQKFQKVNVIALSPNHWDGESGGTGVGNKHYMFFLDGCANEDTARGFFNEFLRADLNEHRKAFELVGSKVRTAPADRQLSGLGFSSTQRNHAIVRVTGAFTRLLKVTF